MLFLGQLFNLATLGISVLRSDTNHFDGAARPSQSVPIQNGKMTRAVARNRRRLIQADQYTW